MFNVTSKLANFKLQYLEIEVKEELRRRNVYSGF